MKGIKGYVLPVVAAGLVSGCCTPSRQLKGFDDFYGDIRSLSSAKRCNVDGFDVKILDYHYPNPVYHNISDGNLNVGTYVTRIVDVYLEKGGEFELKAGFFSKESEPETLQYDALASFDKNSHTDPLTTTELFGRLTQNQINIALRALEECKEIDRRHGW